MAWSTREIAELAGTSLRAVRHYHEVGLLAEPERRTNGYKQYGVTHLVRLLRIKRLTDLGFSLTQIAAMGDDQEHPEEALRSLDAELAATIERLQRVRIELGVILRNSTPADLPAELAGAADVPMSDADRQLAIVSTRVLGPTRLRAYADMLASAYETTPSDAEFDEMPPDTDEATRQAVAERMLPQLRVLLEKHPELTAPNTDAPRGERHAQETLAKAMRELYNPAQLDTMRRLGELIAQEAAPPAR